MKNIKQLQSFFLFGVGVGVILTGCTPVDVLRFTNQTFPPKVSTQEVEIIDREPPCDHIAIAQLSVEDSNSAGYWEEQRAILKEATKLGADAVIFSKPEKHVQHDVVYETSTVGGPWGMGSYGYPGWGYGMGWNAGYGGAVAVPYDYTVKSLSGVAIRYTNLAGPKC